jgi:hypothetical protein
VCVIVFFTVRQFFFGCNFQSLIVKTTLGQHRACGEFIVLSMCIPESIRSTRQRRVGSWFLKTLVVPIKPWNRKLFNVSHVMHSTNNCLMKVAYSRLTSSFQDRKLRSSSVTTVLHVLHPPCCCWRLLGTEKEYLWRWSTRKWYKYRKKFRENGQQP